MNVSKLTPILVLGASVALGFWITSSARLDYSEPTATAQNVAAFDDTCSAASPDAVTCEMPEEISRADYFRLVAKTGKAENVAQANPRQVNNGEKASAADSLPSWNDSASKTSIIEFVEKVTKEGSPDFVPEAERIAVFDNDGTLWCEQPMYTQLAFAIDEIKRMAPDHPEWQDQEPYKSILAGDLKSVLAQGEKALLSIVAATHSGMTTTDFNQSVKDWISTAHHPRFKQPYNECIYQPMVEVLDYLRANGFKTFIVSGGGIDFMRPWTHDAYGIPPEQIVGSCGKMKFEVREGKPVLMKLPEVDFIDDKAGKPVGIERFIGRRPIIAFGNSDGDFEMLQYTTEGEKLPRLGLIVHHTDAEREYAYDNPSKVGQLKRGLEEAPKQGWVVIDMKNDWKKIFSFEK